MKVTVRNNKNFGTVYGELDLSIKEIREISRQHWLPIQVDGNEYVYESYRYERQDGAMQGTLFVTPKP